MMNVTLYGLKSCDTCRKAMKALRESGYEVTCIDVRQDRVDSLTLAKFQSEFGQALVNTRSTTWRNLSDDDRTRPALELLSEHPTLMKRPVIDAGGVLTLGWTKDVQAKF